MSGNNSKRRETLDRGSSGVGSIMSASSSVNNKSSCNNISSPLIPRILSGSLGSIVTALAVTPLEVVKIRQQASGATNNIAPTSFRGIKVEPCAKGW